MSEETQINILYVDDEIDWHEILKRLLNQIIPSAQIVSALSFQEAQSLIERQFFHAAILDIRLNHQDKTNEEGMILQHMIAQKGKTGIIMLSGFGTTDRIIQSWDNERVVGFIQKDQFNVEKLRHLLKLAMR